MRQQSVFLLLILVSTFESAAGQQIQGLSVTPHSQSSAMRWRRAPDPELAARVEIFLQNVGDSPVTLSRQEPILFDDKAPQDLLKSQSWSWHDTPQSWIEPSVTLPPESLTVFSINGRSAAWGIETSHAMQIGSGERQPFALVAPAAWLSAVTFLSAAMPDHSEESLYPNQIVVHLHNADQRTLQILSCRLWLPQPGGSHHVLHRAHEFTELNMFPEDGNIVGLGKGGFVVNTPALPLTYAVVEVRVRSGDDAEYSLWSHLRIKREIFDISGGWVASDIRGRNSLTIEEYLKTLKRMHINTGQHEEVGGYTDNAELYRRYPLKRFNRLQSLERYDRDEMLPLIHAVEFLGEPQFGGGRPVAPQEVWEQLAPYQTSRLATTVTLSEERTWRYYAGLSDYPHYDAYRVIAPAADAWRNYDRWGGQQIRWGAPLETIGDMTRSLRELSRPRSIAYWSQGAHDGWGGIFSPRRGSPNADELRAQAWHGLANRITSLYWFNLSLKSIVKFPDLIEPITRVNREIRLIDEILLSGDAFEYRRLETDGKPDWDLTSIAAPHAALLATHDLDYQINPERNEFQFAPRTAKLQFTLPSWLKDSPDVFRIDADGTHDVAHAVEEGHVVLEDQIHVVGLYVVTTDKQLRSRINAKLNVLLREEGETGFDPGNNEEELTKLREFLER